MRINNPRSFIGGSSDNVAYNLVTKKILDNESSILSSAIKAGDEALSATFSAVDNALNTKIDTTKSFIEGEIMGSTGTSISQYGYAWLDETGKIPTRLIPTLAISDIQTIKDTDLLSGLNAQALQNLTAGQNKKEIYTTINNKLAVWPDFGSGEPAKKGDILIVVPDSYAANPNIHGSYIVIGAPGDTYANPTPENPDQVSTRNTYLVTRLSYDNGNISTINEKGLDSGGTPGSVTLFLHDILKERYYVDRLNELNLNVQQVITSGEACMLESTIYRLSTINNINSIPAETEEGSYRFAFKDEAGAVVPYAKLRELNDVNETLSTLITTNVTRIDGAINFLSGTIDSETSRINTALDFISGTQLPDEIAAREAAVTAEENARQTADTNIWDWLGQSTDSTLGDSTITKKVNKLIAQLSNRTNSLKLINNNLNDFAFNFNTLADNAVRLKYKTITWDSAVEITDGVAIYKYEFETTSSNNYDAFPERIIAVYDEENNLVYPDIKVDKEHGKTTITVELEESLTAEYQLENKEWTLLIAEPIKKINTNITVFDKAGDDFGTFGLSWNNPGTGTTPDEYNKINNYNITTEALPNI